ncbi:hypothetical protein [Vacuolonema iberomarrocanum]|uniref:hypothetical protein n=1 Tax=Vacuolonema iberomarrocanum TaxID=3454632 RepID=UPI0019FA6AF4|nr:hypothetical protein [filamentous cyanobacterium LEGE 07170]
MQSIPLDGLRTMRRVGNRSVRRQADILILPKTAAQASERPSLKADEPVNPDAAMLIATNKDRHKQGMRAIAQSVHQESQIRLQFAEIHIFAAVWTSVEWQDNRSLNAYPLFHLPLLVHDVCWLVPISITSGLCILGKLRNHQ